MTDTTVEYYCTVYQIGIGLVGTMEKFLHTTVNIKAYSILHLFYETKK